MHQAKACFWDCCTFIIYMQPYTHVGFPQPHFYLLLSPHLSWSVLELNLSCASFQNEVILRKRWLFWFCCLFVLLAFSQRKELVLTFSSSPCFIWFYFRSRFGRVKDTMNCIFFFFLSHLKDLKLGRGPFFFSLSHWYKPNWCEASGLPLLNLSRAWRISLLQSALEAWSTERMMTTLIVNCCTLWVSVISAFNV